MTDTTPIILTINARNTHDPVSPVAAAAIDIHDDDWTVSLDTHAKALLAGLKDFAEGLDHEADNPILFDHTELVAGEPDDPLHLLARITITPTGEDTDGAFVQIGYANHLNDAAIAGVDTMLTAITRLAAGEGKGEA